MSVNKVDLAIGVLELDQHVFPEQLGLYLLLAKNPLRRNDRARAEAVLQQALVISPGNNAVLDLMAKIHQERIPEG